MEDAAGETVAGADLSFFVDKEDVLLFIEIITRSTGILECCEAFDKKYEWLVLTLSKYQEQPLLLNSSLSDLISPLADRMLNIAFNLDMSDDKFSQVCTVIFSRSIELLSRNYVLKDC